MSTQELIVEVELARLLNILDDVCISLGVAPHVGKETSYPLEQLEGLRLNAREAESAR